LTTQRSLRAIPHDVEGTEWRKEASMFLQKKIIIIKIKNKINK
jgi:hypothetical protein